ncbi:MAG: VWA domain-containing protein [Lachnospiraceae bacterium]
MKLMKKFSKHIAGIVCMIMILTSVQLPSLGCEVKSENNTSINSAQEEIKEPPSQTTVPILTSAYTSTPLDESEYHYEDEFIKVTIQAENPMAIPAGGALKVRTIKAEDENLINKYNLVSTVLTEMASQNQFVVDGFLAYEVYFEFEGQEIMPQVGMMNITMSFKQELVPEAYKTSVQTGKDIKLYQLETIEQKVNAVDRQPEVTQLQTTDGGGVSLLEFKTDNYEPFVFTWKEDVRVEEPNVEEPKDENKKTENPKVEIPKKAEDQKRELKEEGLHSKGENFTDAGPLVKSNDGRNKSLLRQAGSMSRRGNTAVQPEKGVDNPYVETSKTVTSNGDGTYELKLEAYTTGNIEQITVPVPADIVLVLDQSGSMEDLISTEKHYTEAGWIPDGKGGWKPYVDTYRGAEFYVEENGMYVRVEEKYVWDDSKRDYLLYWESASKEKYIPEISEITTLYRDNTKQVKFFVGESRPSGPKKIDALREAVKNFVKNVETDATKNHVNHRIAIAGFSSKKSQGVYFNNTELMTADSGIDYSYYELEIEQQYGNSLQDVSTDKGKKIVEAAIGRLSAKGSTRADEGLDMAKKVLDNNPNQPNEKRSKVVVMFTDGEPTSSWGFEPAVANQAIDNAKKIKDLDATVYTIGVLDGADKNDMNGNVNKYMNLVSSNYPNAISMNEFGNRENNDKNYYLTATNAGSLNEIFIQIQEEIKTPSIQLDESTVITDYISDYFQSDNSLKSCQVYTSENIGKNQWGPEVKVGISDGITLDINKEKKTVSVSGFNYMDNFVYTTSDPSEYGGKKLVVKIQVKPNDDFIGGNNVPTNTSQTSIINNLQTIENFPEPITNIALQYDTKVYNKSIYITETWKDIQEFFLRGEKIKYQIGKNEYQINGINNAYANITYTIKDEKGSVIGTYTIPAGAVSGSWVNGLDLNSKALNENKKFRIDIAIQPSQESKDPQKGVKDLMNSKEVNLYVFTPSIEVSNQTIFLGESTKLNDRVQLVEWENKSGKGIEKPISQAPDLEYIYYDDRSHKLEPQIAPSFNVSNIKLGVSANKRPIENQTKIENISTPEKNDRLFHIYVVKGQLFITKTIDQSYTNIKQIKSNQAFVFKIQQYEMDEKGNKTEKLVQTFYETIHFDANNGETSKTKTISRLKRGYYVVTEETNWSVKYNQIKKEATELQIGKMTRAGTGTTLPCYIGTDPQFTKHAETEKAESKFNNQLKASNWLSDTTHAVNRFEYNMGPM